MQVMAASDVLARMKSAYESAATYTDTGRVYSLGPDGDEPQQLCGLFSTSFVRASETFRFTYRDVKGESYVIQAEHGVLTELRVPFAYPLRTLGAAIAGITGITYGSAHSVPRMLMANRVDGRALWSAAKPSVTGRESVRDDVCCVVDLGEEWQATRVLISEISFALRRELRPIGPLDHDSVDFLTSSGRGDLVNIRFGHVIDYESHME